MKDKSRTKSMTEEGVFIQTRMRRKLKEDAQALCSSLGVTMSDVIRMMLIKAVKEGKIPFEL